MGRLKELCLGCFSEVMRRQKLHHTESQTGVTKTTSTATINGFGLRRVFRKGQGLSCHSDYQYVQVSSEHLLEGSGFGDKSMTMYVRVKEASVTT